MKKIILMFAITAGVVFAGCSSIGGGDPKDVLAEFFDALANKDIEKAKKLSTEDSKSMIDMIQLGMNSSAAKENMKYDKNNMEFGEVNIDGDVATVSVKDIKSQESINYKLKKEKGQWKVAFDKASLMGMGMEKMEEEGINPMEALDSLKNTKEMEQAMEELKSVDMDSLGKALKESMSQ